VSRAGNSNSIRRIYSGHFRWRRKSRRASKIARRGKLNVSSLSTLYSPLYLSLLLQISEFEPLSLPSSTSSHPITLDATGSMRTDLLAHEFNSPKELSLWRNLHRQKDSKGSQTSGFLIEKAPLLSPRAPGCKLASPHSSAFIDLNGDCLADLFLVCSSSSSQNSYQIWTAIPSSKLNSTGSGYKLAREGLLPPNAGALSFADMDRDGTIDVVFPTCDKGEGLDGIGKGDCYINVAYNKQVGLCSAKGGLTTGGGGAGVVGENIRAESGGGSGESKAVNGALCRRTEELCSADDDFVFDFSQEVSTTCSYL